MQVQQQAVVLVLFVEKLEKVGKAACILRTQRIVSAPVFGGLRLLWCAEPDPDRVRLVESCKFGLRGLLLESFVSPSVATGTSTLYGGVRVHALTTLRGTYYGD